MKTNLEHYKDLFINNNGDMCHGFKRKICKVEGCNCTGCIECHKEFIEWVLEECKELKIQLLQWEYDLIEVQVDDGHKRYLFDCFPVLRKLRCKGYFKNVTEDMRIDFILENCEIVEEIK